jgi:hypothetical protein
MTQYMISVWHEPDLDSTISDEDMQRMFAQVDAFNQKITAAGKWVFGGGLEPVDTATCVDGRDGGNVVTDGPFIESKEVLGGFWVLECADLDEALALAREASAACEGKVEVRPFQAEPPAE